MSINNSENEVWATLSVTKLRQNTEITVQFFAVRKFPLERGPLFLSMSNMASCE